MTIESCRSFASELMSGPFQGPFLMGAYTLTCGASIFACWKLTGLIIFPKLGIPIVVAGFVIVPAGLILLTMVLMEKSSVFFNYLKYPAYFLHFDHSVKSN